MWKQRVGTMVAVLSMVLSWAWIADAAAADERGSRPDSPPPVSATRTPIPEPPPESALVLNHAAIFPEDFDDVFTRVILTEPYSQNEFTQAMDDLDVASTAEGAAELLPQSISNLYPEVLEFIESGTPMASLTAFTGENVPPAPPAGAAHMAGFPVPYGLYTTNPTNNWGMPNSPTGGCGPFFIRGDGLYFDFRRACRQHDLAYRWEPVSRLSVDFQFYQEMLYDCSLRNPVSKSLCAIRASLYFAAVRLLGASSYGTLTPGYSKLGGKITWPAPYSSQTICAQPTFSWIATDGFGNRVPRNRSLFFTGVVRQFSRVRFQLFDQNGKLALEHMTHPARTNCVIHHEQEEVPASTLANGVYQVRALHTPWETEEVTEVDLGTLEIFTPTGTTTCLQNSHAWVHTTANPVVAGATVYPTGVVKRYTRVSFTFVAQVGYGYYQHTSQPARSNCVVHHEPEAHSTAGWAAGLYDIYATYTEWETDFVVTKHVGVLTVQAGGGGGGGWGGGCPFKDPTTCGG